MILTHKITLDLDRRGDRPVIDAVQGDTARAVEISLQENGAAWPVPEGASAAVRYRRIRGGAGGIYDTLSDGSAAYTLGENGVTVHLAPQVLAAPGPVELQVTLVKDGAELNCFGILILVQGNLSDMEPDEECYVNLTTQIKNQLDQALEEYAPTGAAGIHVGPEEPEGDDVVLWVDTAQVPAQDTGNSSCQWAFPDWKKLKTLETTEEVWGMTVELEENALREIKLYIIFPMTSATTSLVVQFNGAEGVLMKNTYTNGISGSQQTRYYGHGDCDGTYISGYINNDWDYISLKVRKYDSFEPGSVRSIAISPTTVKFAVGTLIEIWGR